MLNNDARQEKVSICAPNSRRRRRRKATEPDAAERAATVVGRSRRRRRRQLEPTSSPAGDDGDSVTRVGAASASGYEQSKRNGVLSHFATKFLSSRPKWIRRRDRLLLSASVLRRAASLVLGFGGRIRRIRRARAAALGRGMECAAACPTSVGMGRASTATWYGQVVPSASRFILMNK